MPGYRSGFVAGDPELIAALKRYRPNVGIAPQEFIQRAAVAAWGDEAHVEAVRARYRAKRDVLLAVLEAHGLRSAGGDATFFLWLDAGPGADALAERLLDDGIVLAPGVVLRARRARATCGWRSCRRSAACERAAERLDALLSITRWRAARRSGRPSARARQRLDRAGLRVAAEQQAVGARTARAALTTVAVRQRRRACRR